jgi:hypothetical protein
MAKFSPGVVATGKETSMRAPLSPTLRHIGEELQRAGEDTVQTPMPWRFLDLLCRLDEVEEAAASRPAEATGADQRCQDDEAKASSASRRAARSTAT